MNTRSRAMCNRKVALASASVSFYEFCARTFQADRRGRR